MLVYGKKSNNDLIPLLLDADGNIIVSASQLTTTGGKIHVDANGNLYTLPNLITSTGAPVRLDSGGNVYVVSDGLSPLSPQGVFKVNNNPNLPAGTSQQILYTIPAAQRLRLTYFSIRYTGTVAGVTLQPRVSDGTNVLVLDDIAPPVSNKPYAYNIDILCEANSVVYCYVIGATLNDDFYGSAAFERLM